MQKKIGRAIVSFEKPFVIDDTGRFVMYLKGKVRADYTGLGVDPVYEIFDIELPAEKNGNEPLKDKKVWVPVKNVTGVVWLDMDW